MAKGNAFNGMLRGRIGDTVFSRKNGAQHSRAYVQEIANPKTTSQSGQRVKFGTIAAFYASAVQNLFKFAFEDKKPGESDYNAFMRLNLAQCAPQTRWAYENGAPCVGNWLMSKGTLATPFVGYGANDLTDNCATLWSGGLFKAQNHVTMGDVSKALEKQYGYHDGDIVTIVIVNSAHLCAHDYQDAIRLHSLTEVMQSSRATWTIKQFVLDSKSEVEVSTDGIFDLTETPTSYLIIKDAASAAGDNAAGVAVIVSRPTKRGLKVSTSRMVCNAATENAIAIGRTEAWWRYCAENFSQTYSLDNTPANILEGSVVAEGRTSNVALSVECPVSTKQAVAPAPGDAVTTIIETLTDDMKKSLVFTIGTNRYTFSNMDTFDDKEYYMYTSAASGSAVALDADSQDVHIAHDAGILVLKSVWLS